MKELTALALRYGYGGFNVDSLVAADENGDNRLIRVKVVPLLLGSLRREAEDAAILDHYSEAVRMARVADEEVAISA